MSHYYKFKDRFLRLSEGCGSKLSFTNTLTNRKLYYKSEVDQLCVIALYIKFYWTIIALVLFPGPIASFTDRSHSLPAHCRNNLGDRPALMWILLPPRHEHLRTSCWHVWGLFLPIFADGHSLSSRMPKFGSSVQHKSKPHWILNRHFLFPKSFSLNCWFVVSCLCCWSSTPDNNLDYVMCVTHRANSQPYLRSPELLRMLILNETWIYQT